VVVFANDIRRGLQRVGSRAWFGGWARAQESKVIDEVVEAATELARHRIGALITFEQEANLDEFVGAHKGLELDAQVTTELLVSLFVPESVNKLHDGSVIIRNYRIAKAGVFFPMPEGRVMDPSFGSRHRAALGITEETDAVVVIVSEERGTISFCFNGNIAPNLDGPKLKTMLEAIFSPKVRRKKKGAQPRRSEAPLSGEPRSVRRDSEATPRPSGRESVIPRDSTKDERRSTLDHRASRPDRETKPLRARPSADRISHTPTLLTAEKFLPGDKALLTPTPLASTPILTPAHGREPVLPNAPEQNEKTELSNVSPAPADRSSDDDISPNDTSGGSRG
jgi:diadenylate cyclase